MVQAMFHVSHPSRIYKTWLQHVLAYLWENRTQTKDEDFDKKFLNKLHCLAYDYYYYQKQQDKLSYPNVSYFMLNYVDYSLWYQWKEAGQNKGKRDEFFKEYAPNQNSSAEELKKAFDKFVFMHRSSIEHCYPRNPEDQSNRKTGADLIALNQLGNLCLVSHSENSRLSNLMPAAKCEKVIARLNSGRSTQSLSQLIMLMHETWDISAIEIYTDKLKDLIENQIEPIAQ